MTSCAAIVVVALAVSACGSSTPERAVAVSVTTSATPSTTAPASTVPTVDTEATTKADVERAYRAAVQAAQEALAIPDPDYPDLAKYNTGAMLNSWRTAVADLRARGLAARFPAPSIHSTTILRTTVSGASAEVEDCEIDDSIVARLATGEVLNDAVSTGHHRITMRRGPNGWQLSERAVVSKVPGASC